ncbi:fucosyl transferase [Ostertagia ostertagi]
MAHSDPKFKRRSDQYVIFFSQESPANADFELPYPDFFNMSLGFRHDTPAASPYGYTIKLASNSRPQGEESFPVDVYGGCGHLKCARGGACESMLDKDYHFYIAFENSICKDYITEKLWNQGYQRDIVPLVLKRSLVEPFVPPNSFIAADDFNNTQDMGNYLHYLMKNKTAYA